MAKVKVTLNHGEVAKLLRGTEVRRELRRRADRVAAAAEALAPEVSGDFKRGIHVRDATGSRARMQIGSSVDYAAEVEADHGVMARALDAAGG